MPTVNIGDNTTGSPTMDYSGLEDTRLDSSESSNNNGVQVIGYAGNQTTRIMKEIQRPDLSSLTASWKVTAASLHLYDTDWSNRSADCTLDIWQIASANGDWIEGTMQDTPEVGSPCWNKKEYDTVSWAGSAGLSTATTDYINTSLGQAVFTDGVSGYRTITFNSSGRTVIEGWLGDATNEGFLITGSGSNNNWTEWKSTQGTDGNRPYYSIDYVAAATNIKASPLTLMGVGI